MKKNTVIFSVCRQKNQDFRARLFPRVEPLFCVLSVCTRVWINICFRFDFIILLQWHIIICIVQH
jgi:hypothetical protein